MYFITCFEKIEGSDFGDIRTFGFFRDLKTCSRAVRENWSDLHECLYDFAVIERIEEGIHPRSEKLIWFKWDKDRQGFFEIESPFDPNFLTDYAIVIG